MKYVAKFELKNNSLKSDYRRVIVSYMKWAISNYMDGTFYDRLYESGSKKKKLLDLHLKNLIDESVYSDKFKNQI